MKHTMRAIYVALAVVIVVTAFAQQPGPVLA